MRGDTELRGDTDLTGNTEEVSQSRKAHRCKTILLRSRTEYTKGIHPNVNFVIICENYNRIIHIFIML